MLVGSGQLHATASLPLRKAPNLHSEQDTVRTTNLLSLPAIENLFIDKILYSIRYDCLNS
jgi:hypothetical protein